MRVGNYYAGGNDLGAERLVGRRLASWFNIDTVGLGVNRSRYSTVQCMRTMHFYAFSCIIVCRLAIGDTRSAYYRLYTRAQKFIELVFVMVFVLQHAGYE